MALFPQLISENKVQIGEKIRFDVTKSFVSRGSTAISTLTIKPEDDITAISVYDASSDNWYLDWSYNDFEIDIDSSNNKIDFQESGGSALVATISSGTYSLSALASEIKTQMDSSGSLTYTVSFDVDDKITISSSGSFALLKSTGSNKNNSLLPIIGFPLRIDGEDTNFSTSHIGERAEWLTRKITIEAGDGTDTSSIVYYLKVYSKDGDSLFSDDASLIQSEPDILKYIPDGKSSFNFVHRESQELILSWLDEKGYVNVYDEKFKKKDIVDVEEFRQWSKFLTLQIIFEGLSNSVDDVFMKKANKYASLVAEHKNRAIIRIDIDDDGKVDTFEDMRIFSGRVFRR